MWFQNWHDELRKLSLEHPEIWKTVYWWKFSNFQLENFRGFICPDTERCCKIYDSWLEKKHKEFDQFSCEQVKVWKFALWSHPFVQSKQKFRWKSTEELCFMTLKSDANFEKKNWHLVAKTTWGIWWILMWAVASLEISVLMC